MITLRKLASLPPGTRRRKIVRLLRTVEEELLRGTFGDRGYLRGLLAILVEDDFWGAEISASAEVLANALPKGDHRDNGVVRGVNNLRHRLLVRLDDAPADWDFALGGAGTPDDGEGDSPSKTYPIRIYLDDLRSPFNVGAVFRSAAAFGAERLWVSRSTAAPTHPRALRSSMGAIEMMPWEHVAVQDLRPRESGPVFALEIGGTDIRRFPFPSEGTVVVGSEELGIGPETRLRAEKSLGLVTIPLRGPKKTLNVAVALGILLERWTASIETD